MSYFEQARDHFDPLSPDFCAEFWGTLNALREHCPVVRSDQYGGFVALTRYEDVVEAATNWRQFSSAHGISIIPLESDFHFIPTDYDPPYQRDIRTILNPFFTKEAIAAYEPSVRAVANEIVDGFVEGGQCEFMGDFALPFPGRVVYEGICGASREGLPELLDYLDTLVTKPQHAGEALVGLVAWTNALLQSRADSPPRDDVVDALLKGRLEDRPLTGAERANTLALLVLAAIDTSQMALGNIAFHLATKPALAERLRGDRSLVERAVDEFLRLEAPVPGEGRYSTTDIELHGQQIAEGERVVLYFGAANRDPRQFSDPDELNIDRTPNNHLSFGFGVHRCLGRHAARLELRVAVETLLDRLPGLRVAPGAELAYRNAVSRGPTALPLEWDTV